MKPHPAPVFVLGNQKSGTTAVAALLSAASGLPATLDFLHRLPADDHRAFLHGRWDAATLLARAPWAFVPPIVKEPSLTFFRGPLAEAFPAARFAFVVRDPRDNIRSILDRLGLAADGTARGGEPTQATASATTSVPRSGAGLGLDDKPGWHFALTRVPGRDGAPPEPAPAAADPVDILTRRWCRAVEVLRTHLGTTAWLRYEDFEADKVGALRRLARQVGLPFVRVPDAELDTAFQPRGDRSQTWQAFFGAERLGRIEAMCAEPMAWLGYAPSGAGQARGRAAVAHGG